MVIVKGDTWHGIWQKFRFFGNEKWEKRIVEESAHWKPGRNKRFSATVTVTCARCWLMTAVIWWKRISKVQRTAIALQIVRPFGSTLGSGVADLSKSKNRQYRFLFCYVKPAWCLQEAFLHSRTLAQALDTYVRTHLVQELLFRCFIRTHIHKYLLLSR